VLRLPDTRLAERVETRQQFGRAITTETERTGEQLAMKLFRDRDAARQFVHVT